MGFAVGSDGEDSPCNAGDPGFIPRWGRSPGEGNGNPLLPVFLPGEFHGQRNLAGYSPWGHKELDTTEWLTLSLFFMRSKCVYNFYIPDGLNFKHYEIFLFLPSKNSEIVKIPCFFFLNAYLKHLICRPLFFFKISWFPSCIFKFGELEGRQHTGNDFLEVKRTLEIKKKNLNINGQKDLNRHHT